MSSAAANGHGHHKSSGYLRLAGVSKRFGDTTVLNDLDLEIGEGEFISLIGPSGSGKTTTLRIIAGLETPTTGGVFVGSEEITSLLPNQRDFGMVLQHFALFPHLDVFQNVAYGLKIRGDKPAAIEASSILAQPSTARWRSFASRLHPRRPTCRWRLSPPERNELTRLAAARRSRCAQVAPWQQRGRSHAPQLA